MGETEINLLRGEHVVARAQLHWIPFLWPGICAAVGLAAVVQSLHAPMPDAGEYSIAAWMLLPPAIAMGAARSIAYLTTELAITNHRVIVKRGLIRRTSLETLLSQVEGVIVQQRMVGRLLGYGTVVVVARKEASEPVPYVAAPFAFRRRVQEQQTSGDPTGGPAPERNDTTQREGTWP